MKENVASEVLKIEKRKLLCQMKSMPWKILNIEAHLV